MPAVQQQYVVDVYNCCATPHHTNSAAHDKNENVDPYDTPDGTPAEAV